MSWQKCPDLRGISLIWARLGLLSCCGVVRDILREDFRVVFSAEVVKLGDDIVVYRVAILSIKCAIVAVDAGDDTVTIGEGLFE